MYRSRPTAERAPPVDRTRKVLGFAVADRALDVALPEQSGSLVEVVHFATCVDNILKRATGST
jgi:hypothetical protein